MGRGLTWIEQPTPECQPVAQDDLPVEKKGGPWGNGSRPILFNVKTCLPPGVDKFQEEERGNRSLLETAAPATSAAGWKPAVRAGLETGDPGI